MSWNLNFRPSTFETARFTACKNPRPGQVHADLKSFRARNFLSFLTLSSFCIFEKTLFLDPQDSILETRSSNVSSIEARGSSLEVRVSSVNLLLSGTVVACWNIWLAKGRVCHYTWYEMWMPHTAPFSKGIFWEITYDILMLSQDFRNKGNQH